MAAVAVRFHDNPEYLWVALAEMLERPSWHRDALCAEPGYKGLPWVPSEGERPSRAATVQMQSVCGQCFAKVECESFARAHPGTVGMWSGRTTTDRVGRRAVKACGTMAAVRSHRQLHEPLCAVCEAVWRADQVEKAPCATRKGAVRHRRFQESLCPECDSAEREYFAARRRPRASVPARRFSFYDDTLPTPIQVGPDADLSTWLSTARADTERMLEMARQAGIAV